LTSTVLRLTASRTETLPRLTRTRVLRQRSSVSHFVPRTVAAPYLPLVRKRPLPSPHRRRTFLFLAEAVAPPAVFLVRQLSLPVSESCVIGLDPRVWVITKLPW
jgi:hypothetical protein